MPETVITVENQGAPSPVCCGNCEYFKTGPGILKLAQLIFSFFCMGNGETFFFDFVSVTAHIATLIWIFSYLICWIQVVKWIRVELVYTGVITGLMLIAVIIELLCWRRSMVGAIFGIFNFLAYVHGTYFLYVEYKK